MFVKRGELQVWKEDQAGFLKNVILTLDLERTGAGNQQQVNHERPLPHACPSGCPLVANPGSCSFKHQPRIISVFTRYAYCKLILSTPSKDATLHSNFFPNVPLQAELPSEHYFQLPTGPGTPMDKRHFNGHVPNSRVARSPVLSTLGRLVSSAMSE